MQKNRDRQDEQDKYLIVRPEPEQLDLYQIFILSKKGLTPKSKSLSRAENAKPQRRAKPKDHGFDGFLSGLYNLEGASASGRENIILKGSVLNR